MSDSDKDTSFEQTLNKANEIKQNSEDMKENIMKMYTEC
jgi:chromosome segregation ATPase